MEREVEDIEDVSSLGEEKRYYEQKVTLWCS